MKNAYTDRMMVLILIGMYCIGMIMPDAMASPPSHRSSKHNSKNVYRSKDKHNPTRAINPPSILRKLPTKDEINKIAMALVKKREKWDDLDIISSYDDEEWTVIVNHVIDRYPNGTKETAQLCVVIYFSKKGELIKYFYDS